MDESIIYELSGELLYNIYNNRGKSKVEEFYISNYRRVICKTPIINNIKEDENYYYLMQSKYLDLKCTYSKFDCNLDILEYKNNYYIKVESNNLKLVHVYQLIGIKERINKFKLMITI